MKNKNLKSGTRIRVYLDGGWEIDGLVLDDMEDRIIVEEGDDPVLLFKSKINAIRIMPQNIPVKKQETEVQQEHLTSTPTQPRPFFVVKPKKAEPEKEAPSEPTAGNNLYYEGSMSIPLTVINSDPEKVNPFNDDDFSISLKSLENGAEEKRVVVSFVGKDE